MHENPKKDFSMKREGKRILRKIVVYFHFRKCEKTRSYYKTI